MTNLTVDCDTNMQYTPTIHAQLPEKIGDIENYIQAVHRFPMLSASEEAELAYSLRTHNNVEAAKTLVLSHLRLVVSVARNYLGYGLPHADLIQEGNLGLMKAVRRFDPDLKVRLVSYAIHWIKAEIHEFILRNWRQVKIATTKAQRKLFFNLRSFKKSHLAMSSSEIAELANELNVKTSDVVEMEQRLSNSDIALETFGQNNEHDSENGKSFSPIAYLADPKQEPAAILASRQFDRLQSVGLEQAINALDSRSQRIVKARWLDIDDEGKGATTLHELAAEFKISAERVRQLEVAAMNKMRKQLENFA